MDKCGKPNAINLQFRRLSSHFIVNLGVVTHHDPITGLEPEVLPNDFWQPGSPPGDEPRVYPWSNQEKPLHSSGLDGRFDHPCSLYQLVFRLLGSLVEIHSTHILTYWWFQPPGEGCRISIRDDFPIFLRWKIDNLNPAPEGFFHQIFPLKRLALKQCRVILGLFIDKEQWCVTNPFTPETRFSGDDTVYKVTPWVLGKSQRLKKSMSTVIR